MGMLSVARERRYFSERGSVKGEGGEEGDMGAMVPPRLPCMMAPAVKYPHLPPSPETSLL